MTNEQLDALLTYIDARIDERIADAFRRDSLNEAIRVCALGAELRDAFNLS